MEVVSAFEAAVLRWIGDHSADPALSAQLTEVTVRKREHTGVGCFSTLDIPAGTPASKQTHAQHGPLDGPYFESPAIEHGGGSLLWFEDGRAECLEVYAYGHDFPEDHSDLGGFKLHPPLSESSGGE